MASNQRIASVNEHILINLAPSLMVLPGIGVSVFPNKSESSQEMLRAVRRGQSPYLFGVMSKPGAQKYPEGFYRTGVIAEAEATLEIYLEPASSFLA